MQQMPLENKFWQYAVTTYAKPAAAPKLLHLQDQFGLDINLLLLMSWLGSCHQQPDNHSLQQCIALATDWQQAIIRPLRMARRNIREKLGDGDSYQQAKALELQLEQQIIARLYVQTTQLALHQTTADCSAQNIDAYIKQVLPDAALLPLQTWLDFAD